MKKQNTDVLIIGGGGAGLCSAIAAAESGASVHLISKSGGNSTAISAGGFAVVRQNTEIDSTECFIADAQRSGAGLADVGLLTMLAEQSAGAIKTLESWGISFYAAEGGHRFFRSGGHSCPRSLRCASGRGGDAYRIMLQKARSCGVHFTKNALITELIKENGRVSGVLGIAESGEPLLIRAKCVILAAGGMAALYSHTTNTSGMTGDGYVLAYQAGCRLRDMEFIQFMPTTIAYPERMRGRLVNDTLRGEGAMLYNGCMERFMERYDPEFLEVSSRDVLSNAIALELAAGRGTPHGGVYLDARGVPHDALLESFGAARQLIAAGIDPEKSLIEVLPAAHFSCGGVAIDAECRTGVDGLFAVGEVTGGIHGANRLGATALTENMVFGSIAGRLAAREAAQANCPGKLESRTLDCISIRREQEPLPELDEALLHREEELKKILWQYAGILRDEHGLNIGIRKISMLRETETLNLQGSVQQFFQQERLRQLLFLGELVLKAAKSRKESRGCHKRLDFPESDSAQAASRFFQCNAAR